jgi:hypothetical protein
VSVASAVRRFSCGLVAAAMIWSLKVTCRWHELGTSVWVKGGAEVADQARRERERPSAVVLAARSAGVWRS